MEVILLERIERLGQMGDVVNVKDGFARNFLLPNNKALRANSENLEFFEKEKINLEAKNLKLKTEAETISEKINVNNYVIIRQASDTGQLYGSVNSGDIKEKLVEEGFIIEKNQVVLDRPIKEIGHHEIKVKLHPEVTSKISIYITRSNDEAESLIKDETSEAKVINNQEIVLEEIFEEGAIPDNVNNENSILDENVNLVDDQKKEVPSLEVNKDISPEEDKDKSGT